MAVYLKILRGSTNNSNSVDILLAKTKVKIYIFVINCSNLNNKYHVSCNTKTVKQSLNDNLVNKLNFCKA